MKQRGMYLRAGIALMIVAIVILAYAAYTSTQAQRRTVLTVKQRIEAGSVITAPMLTTMELPAPQPGSRAPWPYFSDPTAVVGRTALVTLLPDTALTQQAVGQAAPPGRLLPSGQVVPPGYLGLAIPTAALRSVGGALKIGDTVTVLIPALDGPQALAPAMPITHTTLFTNVPIVDLRDEAGKSLIAGEATSTAAYIVLSLDPDQAEAVARYQDLLILAVEGK